jgi:hypothetical protein
VAPKAGGNPGGSLLDLQRRLGPALLEMEVAALAPARVLVTTGRWWFEPFADRLRLRVEGDDDVAVARDGGRLWVIGPHPQGKRREVLPKVVAKFDGEQHTPLAAMGSRG